MGICITRDYKGFLAYKLVGIPQYTCKVHLISPVQLTRSHYHIFFHTRDIQVFVFCRLEKRLCRNYGDNMETHHKIKNIFGNTYKVHLISPVQLTRSHYHIFFHTRDIQVFVFCRLEKRLCHNGDNMETHHKIKNIFGNNQVTYNYKTSNVS